VMYILILMLLVFYFYAVCGVSLFRENDPFHFANIPLAFETLFRCATLEDWTDVWYINYHGCEEYHFDIYTTNATLATNSIYPRLFLCESYRQPWIATLFFISFIWIASFILLSLFVGSILISTMDAVLKIADTVKRIDKEKRNRIKGQAAVDFLNLVQRRRRQAVLKDLLIAWRHSETLKEFSEAQEKRINKLTRAKPEFFIAVDSNLEAQVSVQLANPLVGGPVALAIFAAALIAEKIRDNKIFSNGISMCILIASVMVGVQATCKADDPECDAQFFIPDLILTYVFLVECVIKILSEFARTRVLKVKNIRNYFADPWNRLDFVVVACSFIPAVGSFALVIRMVRLLRVLKVLRVVPELQMLVNALISSQESVMYVSLIMFLFFYMVAIFAMIVYRDNDTFHFGTLHQSLFSLFRIATGDDWTDIMYTAQYGCEVYPVLHTFKKTQFMTPQDLPLTTGFHDCLAPHAHKASAVFFFVWFHMIGGMVFLNLFIGVVTVGMGDAMQEIENVKIAETEIGYLAMPKEEGGIGLKKEQLAAYRRIFDCTDFTNGFILNSDDFAWVLQCVGLDPTKEEVANLVRTVLGQLAAAKKTRYPGGDDDDDGGDEEEGVEGEHDFTLDEFMAVLEHTDIQKMQQMSVETAEKALANAANTNVAKASRGTSAGGLDVAEKDVKRLII
jgi:voltage-gated sodium channel